MANGWKGQEANKSLGLLLRGYDDWNMMGRWQWDDEDGDDLVVAELSPSMSTVVVSFLPLVVVWC